MSAGSIIVDLLMRTGSFDTDVQRSTKAAEKRFKEMERTASDLGKKIGAAFGTFISVQAINSLLDGVDALNDVADATGSTVEKISALEDVAVRTGTSMDTVSSALVKFNQSLGKADGKDDVSRALKAIGLEASALKQMDPADALLATATALSKFADDGDKARLVQELFGKSVAEVAPLLKDLADKGELVATVTTEQAKQAEAFNQQLFGLQKNVKDLGRSILGDLLPPLNALLNAMKESGGLMGFLTTGGNQTADPGAALNDINAKLATMKKLREDLDPSKSFANSLNDKVFGDVGDLDKQIGLLEKQRTYLKSLQSFAALQGLGDAGDAVSRRLASRSSVGPLAPKKEKGPDPDADFKAYLNNLQQQVQKTNDLTVSEKLLDDIRRGSLTVSPEQKKQLEGLAQIVDKEKELAAALKERMAFGRAAAMAEADAFTRSSEEYQALIKRLTEAGPMAQQAKSRAEQDALRKAMELGVENGGISQDAYRDAINGLPALNSQIAETKSLTEQLGLTFTSAFEGAAFGGGKLSDMFKGLLQDILKLIWRLQVVEPLMKSIQGGGGVPGNPDYKGGSGGGVDWAGMAGTVMSWFGGARADGGPVASGKTYLVGERGPEMFTPRTAGAIVPNHALGGGGVREGNLTIVTPPGVRIGDAQLQRISPTERALILQEARQMVAADFANGNSDISRSASRNLNVRRKLA